MKFRLMNALLACFLLLSHTLSADGFTRTENVIYGDKYGMALTLDVLQPPEPNGYGIVFAVSGGWFSSRAAIQPSGPLLAPLLERGYTVFAVVHGSQPKFTIPEITEDMHRAVRFIRHNRKDYGIKNSLGITGGSAGGHLSLVLGTQGGPGEAEAEDPIERETSAVQAVACLYPPTDFLNYGRPGEDGTGVGLLANFKPAFGPRAEDPEEREKLGREISPIYFVRPDQPPTLIIHGDADKLVPIQQAETFVRRATETGATAELIVREGAGHGWPEIKPDVETFADWFDEHLRGIPSNAPDYSASHKRGLQAPTDAQD